MKRTLIIMLALGMVLALATPAAAKNGKGHPAPPEYTVTMAFQTVDNETQGLSTTCDGQTSITMTGNLQSGLRADGVMLGMNVPIEWDRIYDAGWGTSGDGFAKCHGLSQSAIDNNSFGGALWLTFLPGDMVQLTWRFDYYWQFGTNARGKTVQEVLEFFEMTSTAMGFDPTLTTPQTVSGVFTVTLFTKEGKKIVSYYEPMGSPTPLSFKLTIAPTT